MSETIRTERGTEWIRSEHVTLGDRGECWLRADETATWLAWVETAYRPEVWVDGRVVREAEPTPGHWWNGMMALGGGVDFDSGQLDGCADTREEAMAFLDRAIPLVLAGRQDEVWAATDEDWQREVEMMGQEG